VEVVLAGKSIAGGTVTDDVGGHSHICWISGNRTLTGIVIAESLKKDILQVLVPRSAELRFCGEVEIFSADIVILDNLDT